MLAVKYVSCFLSRSCLLCRIVPHPQQIFFWLFCVHVSMDFLSLHVFCNSYARKRRRRITIFPTTMDPAAEIRRQRDNIRHEMEQLVRTMQRLEPDVDNKRPGWEAKRDELAVHRQRLSELRGKMRQVMDAAANAGHSTPGASSMTPRQPQVLFPSHSTSASRVSPNRRSASPLRDRDPSPSHISSTGTAAHQLQDLAAIHRDEKRRLAEEVARLNDAMDRRHTQERAELEHRLQQEEKHLREYEMARQRMEEAQRQLEALKRPANVGGVSTRGGGGGAIPELEALIRR